MSRIITEIYLTEFQRKRVMQGRTIEVLKKGVWFRIKPANRNKIQKIKNQLKELKERLKSEMRKKTNKMET